MLTTVMQRAIEPLRVHMSMRNVVATAYSTMQADKSALGRIAATRGGPIPEDLQRKIDAGGVTEVSDSVGFQPVGRWLALA